MWHPYAVLDRKSLAVGGIVQSNTEGIVKPFAF